MREQLGAPTIGGDDLLNQSWVKKLIALQSNWDSYGASPISIEALKTVGLFAVVPCSNGGVQLEIHRNGYDIEIEITSTGIIKNIFVSCEKLDEVDASTISH